MNPGTERREFKRVGAEVNSVVIEEALGPFEHKGQSANISETGMGLLTSGNILPKMKISVSFHLPGYMHTFNIPSVVVWAHLCNGHSKAGIRFTQLNEHDRYALHNYVATNSCEAA